jgi:t-SNARE complex subunit (syntaxin)
LVTLVNKQAVRVNEDREMVQRVEKNVDDAYATINLSLITSYSHGITYQSNLQTSRAVFFNVFSILAAFVITLFVVFFAYKIKSTGNNLE